MKFTFKNLETPLNKTVVLFTTEELHIDNINSLVGEFLNCDLKQYFNNAKFSGKNKEVIVIPTSSDKVRKIIMVGVSKDKKTDPILLKKAGAKAFDAANDKEHQDISILFNTDINPETASHILFGMRIRSNIFSKYITKKKDDFACHLINNHVLSKDNASIADHYKKFEALASGIELTKELANEPPNIIYPETFTHKCKELEKLGVEVEILDKKQMEKLGMGALLGVAKGSSKEPKLAIMRWNGANDKSDSPLAFVGKGVTFDTGGLSLKPAASMVKMKYDMTGAAVVTGLIKTLATRKAKVNVVCVAGLVENAIGSDAQHPDDIVTSMSGQTIEVLNTDAEGRLVLADALWYTQDRFKPKFMIDLATLTGAITIALADQYAGLFSNDDTLCEKLYKAGVETDEKLWRFPLSEEYDKMIDSKIADMQNISDGRGAGSITAAQFLQRFVNKTPWAHLDIAGVDNVKSDDVNQPGSTGFGVQLLNKFVEDNYEQ